MGFQLNRADAQLRKNYIPITAEKQEGILVFSHRLPLVRMAWRLVRPIPAQLSRATVELRLRRDCKVREPLHDLMTHLASGIVTTLCSIRRSAGISPPRHVLLC